jgi:subtilisin-like proprotein convertase family protein
MVYFVKYSSLEVILTATLRPELLHNLLEAVQQTLSSPSEDQGILLVQKRALQTFYLIIKELCSRKLPRHRKALEEVRV